MTSALRELLASWKMPDSVIQKFEDEEFDEYSLLTLSRDKISELIVKQGPRSKFEFELEKLKRKNSQDCSQSPSKKTKQTTDESIYINSIETTLNATSADLSDIPIAGIDSTQDTILEVSSQVIPDEQFVRYNLIEVLSKSPDGQCGLAYYNHHKKLDDAHRNKIARCVVSDIILRDSNKKLTRSVAECVTNEIVKQFESEKLFKNIWYDKSGGINSGKLFVQYHGIRRKLRSSGVIPSQKKNNQS